MTIALLVIDMQTNFLEEQVEKAVVHSACEYINHVAGLLRENNHTVIHVKDIEGADESSVAKLDFIPEIVIGQDDIQINKEYSNAFWKTELEAVLSDKGIQLVIVSGFAAEHCVLFTYNGALERGFKAAILQKGILSTQNAAIDQTYRHRHVVAYPVIEYLVSQQASVTAN
ncbi:cysteine hydrolase family protein [Paenibacillus agri]|uniref:Cysteine hydrolase n=1 Tax=Paenibacillus agri TaxID=2744309 RepID=A0A850EL50_9BACL|nr:isochorismatase family cysteine hydrolase [Paenibacillus agri]NUU61755.1 cysteine hydrolase [Paenibacillus agri]